MNAVVVEVISLINTKSSTLGLGNYVTESLIQSLIHIRKYGEDQYW